MTSEIAASELAAAPLGHATHHPDAYAPELLFALPRAPQRAALGIGERLPFAGADVWTAYELTWLDRNGKPRVAVATIVVPAESPRIVESKSMKLYLGSFAQTRFAAAEDVTASVERDLGVATGGHVRVTLAPADAPAAAPLAGTSLDGLDVSCTAYDVDPALLVAREGHVRETVTTDLFRSLCPVTAQPDIASMQITYAGRPIDHAGLLRYLVSYRCHAGFHEHCVERIFMDVKRRCAPVELTIHARFLRRGGLDINPFRSDAGVRLPANLRTARQ